VASNLTVGVIAGGALIAGALIGGASQVLVSWSQHRHDREEQRLLHLHDREERRRLAKANVYREVLRHLYSLPGLYIEATPLKRMDWEKLVADWGCMFDLLKADLSMFAPPEIRGLADDVRPALAMMSNASDDEPVGSSPDVENVRKRFALHVQPVIQRLADAMATDADVR
jgi:hypothetical protein